MSARAITPALAGTLLAAVTVADVASAQSARSRAIVGVDAEVSGQLLVDRENSALYGAGVGGAVDLELNVHPLLGIHAGAIGTYFFPGSDGVSSGYYGGRLGLRVHPLELLDDVSHDLWLDAHVTYGVSAGIARPGFDVGLGAAFRLTQGVRVGPFVRLDWSNDPLGADPLWLGAGLTLELLGDPRHDRPAADTDRDGVIDPDDACPAEPAGAHPDPRRRGCALRDTDADAVFDNEDECPTVPAGAHPDAARRGCPSTDRDGDGLADGDDRCPNEAGPAPTGCPPHDTDGDGVLDEADVCSTTPGGNHPDPDRPGCPDPDGDADGIPDHDDACRTQPAGLHPDPARAGCPMPDQDGDSIPDATDACPDRAGAPSRDARRNGCPGLTVIQEGQIRILRPVFFAPRQDRILPRSRPVLRALAEAMLATPQITMVSIEGHTDDLGEEATNLDLSRRRAANVMAYLVLQGVEATRMRSEGFGESRPLINAPTADARAANRRVEFRIVGVRGAE